MKYRGWSGFWRNCARLWSAAVLVTAFALTVTSAPTVAVPAVAETSAEPSGPHSVSLLASAPLHRPAPKLPGGGSGTLAPPAQIPKGAKEIVADRTATTSTWQNPNGTLAVRSYLTPHFYKSGSSWLPISTTLSPATGKPDGGTRNSAHGVPRSARRGRPGERSRSPSAARRSRSPRLACLTRR
jgi:hypothetical protein